MALLYAVPYTSGTHSALRGSLDRRQPFSAEMCGTVGSELYYISEMNGGVRCDDMNTELESQREEVQLGVGVQFFPCAFPAETAVRPAPDAASLRLRRKRPPPASVSTSRSPFPSKTPPPDGSARPAAARLPRPDAGTEMVRTLKGSELISIVGELRLRVDGSAGRTVAPGQVRTVSAVPWQVAGKLTLRASRTRCFRVARTPTSTTSAPSRPGSGTSSGSCARQSHFGTPE